MEFFLRTSDTDHVFSFEAKLDRTLDFNQIGLTAIRPPWVIFDSQIIFKNMV